MSPPERACLLSGLFSRSQPLSRHHPDHGDKIVLRAIHAVTEWWHSIQTRYGVVQKHVPALRQPGLPGIKITHPRCAPLTRHMAESTSSPPLLLYISGDLRPCPVVGINSWYVGTLSYGFTTANQQQNQCQQGVFHSTIVTD